MLDLDATLDALMCDNLNSSHLYVIKLNPSTAECIQISAETSGHTLVANCSGSTRATTATVNGTLLQPTRATLSEEMVTERFGHFGTVERVVLPAKPGKHTRQAFISE